MLVLSKLLILVLILGWFDTRSPLFQQERVGKNQRSFTLVKFRTMRPDTASVASHLADGTSAITPLGRFLRQTKVDGATTLECFTWRYESCWSTPLFVFNQQNVIVERAARGVFDARPGITGLAQIRGIDMLKNLNCWQKAMLRC